MAADSAGNDIEAVGIPVTGFLAYADMPGATIPTAAGGAAAELTLTGFKKAGLLKVDGGFEWIEEPDGDPVEFWQDGYTIPTGRANVTLKFTTAEESPTTRSLRSGKTPDANGYITVDGGGNAKQYAFFTEEAFRNGAIRRRAAIGRVQSAKLQKNERGEVQGTEFTVTILRREEFDGEHYGEWVIAPEAGGEGI